LTRGVDGLGERRRIDGEPGVLGGLGASPGGVGRAWGAKGPSNKRMQLTKRGA
jgi:hypothetical protein